MGRRARVLHLLFFVSALGLLMWLLNQVGWSNIGQALVRVGVSGAILLVALGFIETIFDTLALTLAIGQRRWARVLVIHSVGVLVNQVLPFDVGEVVKGGLTHRAFPTGATIAGTIVWNYVFKISRPLMILVAALIGLVAVTHVAAPVRYLFVVGALTAFVPYALFRLILRRGGAATIVHLLRFAGIVRRDPEVILEKARAIDAIVAGFWRERPGAFVATLILQMAARIVSGAGLFATLRLLGLAVSVGTGALLYAAMNTAELLLTVAPTRLGTSDGAAFGVFTLLSLPPQIGVIMYVVFRVRSLTTTGILAPFAFLTVPPATPAHEPPSSLEA